MRVQAGALVMSTLLLAILGVSVGHQYCSVWREIAPCTCKTEYKKISINCEKMNSFADVANLLQDRFSPDDRIILRIAYSNLNDLSQRSFNELNMTIEDLKLHHDGLSNLSNYTFSGLTHVSYLSLADNPIPYVPIQVFKMMPKIKTLDIGRLKLQDLPSESFRSIPLLDTLVLPGNMLYRMDTDAIPPTVTKLHLARDSIRDLNGTLRNLTDLQWLFLSGNDLTSLDGELPKNSNKLRMLHAGNNKIYKLPAEIKNYPNLDKLFFQQNQLTGLDRVLSKSRKLETCNLQNNRISTLLPDDFAEAESLSSLELQYNYITSLNRSLVPLRNLQAVNLTHNLLTEFSWQEIKGLKELRVLDLSFNKISLLTGLTPNLVEWETKLKYLKLDHNELHSLNGALSGLRSLLRLNLSFNSLTRISPDDLIGLDQLTMLDVSHNQLTTLEETSKTFLPALEELIASHNYLTVLDKDFHGLPVLCWADLSHNQIVALGRDLVSKTHCRVHDGVHEDNWGTLKLYLKENPILCDAALPEINSAMEINHTRIVGVSLCLYPLSEQPVTSKPNAFLGYIPDSTPSPNIEPLYKIDSNNVVRESLNHDGRNLQDLNFRQAIPQEQFVPMEENHPAIRHSHGFHHGKILEPLPYHKLNENAAHVRLGQGHTLNDEQAIKRLNGDQAVENQPNHVQTKLTITELPLNDQPIYTNVDPKVQEQQISQLASEIEQLRARVQELSSENQRLAQNLHNILPEEARNKIYETHHEILPLEQQAISSTEKPPNGDGLRSP